MRIWRTVLMLLCLMVLVIAGLSGQAKAQTFEQYLAEFPASYQDELTELHQQHPNWVFVAVDTGLDWYDSVIAESDGEHSLVPLNSSDILKSKAAGDYTPETDYYICKDASWVAASPIVVAFYMDPRNFLNGQYIYQFELLSFNDSLHSQDGVEEILDGTFMHETLVSYLDADGNTVDTDKTYSDLIMEAAEESHVSPYYLASKIKQEIGNTPSGSVTGCYSGYDGYYNFYNIGATSSTTPIANGLKWACSGTTYQRPWTSPELSIVGGAIWIGESFINAGQNSGYLQRFNVMPEDSCNLYQHQYMTNVAGAASEALSTYNAYNQMGNLDDDKVFYIPVYDDMPAADSTVTFTAVTNKTATVNTAGTNVRSGPGISYSSTGIKLPAGTEVKIISGSRTDVSYNQSYIYYPYWYKISFDYNGEKTSGYVYADLLDIESSVSLSAGATQKLSYKLSPNSSELPFFESSNRNIVSIDSSGKITATGSSGSAVISVFSAGGGFDRLKVLIAASNDDPPDDTSDLFDDVKTGDWYYNAVKYVAENQLMTGVGKNMFSPNTSMTRAMFVTVLGRMYEQAGGNISNYKSSRFNDVEGGSWYCNYVEWAAENGIVNGYGDSLFGTNDSITREQMCAILVRYCQFAHIDLDQVKNKVTFADAADIASWAQNDVTTCQRAGLIEGSNNLFKPRGTATRAEVATILMRFDNM